jgi:hypothetical protein
MMIATAIEMQCDDDDGEIDDSFVTYLREIESDTINTVGGCGPRRLDDLRGSVLLACLLAFSQNQTKQNKK